MNTSEIKKSFNWNIGSKITAIFNDPKIIEENKDLKDILEILFGNNYVSFLVEEEKSHTELIVYLDKLLNGKYIFEIVELLKLEKEKREKLRKELESLKSTSFESVFDEAEKALLEFKFDEYHKLIEDYRENTLSNKVVVFAKTYFIQAEELRARFKYDEAITYYKKAIYYDKNNSRYLNKLGVTYNKNGDYPKAIKHHKKALNVLTKTIGNKNIETAVYYNDLGLARINNNDYDKAIKELKKSIKIGCNNIAATSYNNLGLAYDKKDDYTNALKCYKKALDIDLKTVGKFHTDTSIVYNNIGMIYKKLSDFENAIYYYREALNINLKTVGNYHPNTSTCYNSLGGAYNHKNGNYDTSMECFKKALDINLNTIGESHPHTALVYNNIGTVFNNQGYFDKAVEYSNKAVEIDLKTIGKLHPDTLVHLENLNISSANKEKNERIVN